MKVDILSRKDQINTKEEDVQLLKEELWTRRMIVKVTMLRRMTTVDDLEIMKEIKRNNTKEWEVVQVLEKNDVLSWKKDGDCIHRRENICLKQHETQRKDFTRES